jgi:hypothetical protein
MKNRRVRQRFTIIGLVQAPFSIDTASGGKTTHKMSWQVSLQVMFDQPIPNQDLRNLFRKSLIAGRNVDFKTLEEVALQ